MRMSRRVVAAACVALFLALAPLLAGCGGSKPSNEVDMGVATFEQASATVKAGSAVHFVDPVTGGTHIICTGQGVKCVAAAGAPAALTASDGMTFNPGDKRDVVFPTAGTYTIVCIIHPGMQVTVTVTS
jgi:plastocyanin